MSAQCRASLAGTFANSASNYEIARVKIRWRSAASEPGHISSGPIAPSFPTEIVDRSLALAFSIR